MLVINSVTFLSSCISSPKEADQLSRGNKPAQIVVRRSRLGNCKDNGMDSRSDGPFKDVK